MEYTFLGRTGLKVSRICLGTMNFGPYASDEDSFKIMDRALELGINFFDTANVYGGDLGHGYTEEVLGKWFKKGNRRENIIFYIFMNFWLFFCHFAIFSDPRVLRSGFG